MINPTTLSRTSLILQLDDLHQKKNSLREKIYANSFSPKQEGGIYAEMKAIDGVIESISSNLFYAI